MQMEEYDTLVGHTYFTLNSSEVRSSQYPLLDYKVMILKKYPHIRLQIYGNTCDLGTEKLNTNLGLSRAMACRDYLISKGIPAYRIIVSTQSFNKPMYPNTTDENRAKNRRCDYEIYAPK
jgi:Outer membrane protein and related peptidoglycan-associated (lipo)proteins